MCTAITYQTKQLYFCLLYTSYELFDGYTYQYLLTCPGYAGRSGTIEPSHSASGALVLKIDEDAVVVTGGAARAATVSYTHLWRFWRAAMS